MKLFAIVGMHRSGTSIASRLLNLLGAHLGPPEDLMPAKPDNPRGFWESLRVTQLHDDLLGYLGGAWDRPPVLPEGWEHGEALSPFRQRIAEVIGSQLASSTIAVWKDPRGSFFLPLWRTAVPISGTVLCVRDPQQVAASLAARDALDPERAAYLWLRHVAAAHEGDAAQLIVDFDEAYERPLELIRRLQAFVGTEAPSDAAVDEIRRFVEPSLRHFPAAAVAADGPWMRLARSAYALVMTLPRGAVSPIFQALIGSWQVEAHLSDELRRREKLFDMLATKSPLG